MDLSIVVVHTGAAALLAPCVESVARHAPDAEAVVVWNRCDPRDARSLAEGHRALRFVTDTRNLGFSRAVNAGVRRTGRPAILLLNGDARLAAGAAERLVRALGNPGVAAAGAQLVDEAGRPRPSWSDLAGWPALALLPRKAREVFGPRPADHGVVEVPALIGAAMAVSRAAWDAVGPFDPRFFIYFVETDWCRRARASGLGIVLDREARVVHPGAGATGDRERADREYDLARLQYVAKTWGPGAAARFGRLRAARAWLNARSNGVLGLASAAAARRARRYAAQLAWYRAGCPAGAGIADAVRASEAELAEAGTPPYNPPP